MRYLIKINIKKRNKFHKKIYILDVGQAQLYGRERRVRERVSRSLKIFRKSQKNGRG